MTTKPPSYEVDLPDEDEIGRRMRDAEWMWMKRRNPFIYRMRAALGGRNEIILPKAVGYTPRAVHTFAVAAIANRLLARFGHEPDVDVVPQGEGQKPQDDAATLRDAAAAAFDFMRRRDGPQWRMAALDAITLGQGVTEIVSSVLGDWPDLVPDSNVKGKPSSKLTRAYPDVDSYAKASMEYKKRAGLPLREQYVPLEDFYPVFENPGKRPVEAFRLQRRSLRSVLDNPLFDTSELAMQLQTTEQLSQQEYPLSTTVTIMIYTNLVKYAYYAYTNVSNGLSFPSIGEMGSDGTWAQSTGTPILLYECDHDLGRLPYASIPGRFGEWNSPSNEIEWVMEALLQQGQALDELWSQGFTNVRVRHWPTTYTTLSKDRPMTKGVPSPLQVDEGGNFYLYEGEEIHQLFEAHDDPMFTYIEQRLRQSMEELGGSPAAFGSSHEGPGPDSGYGENLQISQAEALENMTAEGLQEGAIDRWRLLFTHIRAIDEIVPIAHAGENDGTKYLEYLNIDPAKLDPLPMLEADVTRPKPIDEIAAGQMGMTMSDDRGGKGPFLSDYTIRKDILRVKDPEAEERRTMFEKVRAMALQSPVFMQDIMTKLALLQAQGPQGRVSQDTAAGADPTLLNTVQGMAAGGETNSVGGVGASTLNNVLGAKQQQGPQGVQGGQPGMPPGQAQPAQAVGLAVSRAGQ